MPDSNMDFARAALAQRRSAFLPLAPATSESYPRCRSQQQTNTPRSVPSRTRRTSSVSGLKVLKLGPVYYGEHPEDHQDDFYAIDESGSQVDDGASVDGSGSTEKQNSFLTLAPTVSSSYPRKPASRPPAAIDNHTRGGTSSRRSSSSSSHSSSSMSSSSTGMRVLKLAPVYWGEHVDDDKADFYDIVPVSP